MLPELTCTKSETLKQLNVLNPLPEVLPCMCQSKETLDVLSKAAGGPVISKSVSSGPTGCLGTNLVPNLAWHSLPRLPQFRDYKVASIVVLISTILSRSSGRFHQIPVPCGVEIL